MCDDQQSLSDPFLGDLADSEMHLIPFFQVESLAV